MNSSFESSNPGVFLVFVDILRKRTAAKERVCLWEPCQSVVLSVNVQQERVEAIPTFLGLTGSVQPNP